MKRPHVVYGGRALRQNGSYHVSSYGYQHPNIHCRPLSTTIAETSITDGVDAHLLAGNREILLISTPADLADISQPSFIGTAASGALRFEYAEQAAPAGLTRLSNTGRDFVGHETVLALRTRRTIFFMGTVVARAAAALTRSARPGATICAYSHGTERYVSSI